MNTKVAIGVVAALIVAGGAYYFYMPKDGAPMGDAQTADTNNKKMAFADFIKQGGSYKCTVRQSVQGVESEGTTYISGDMIRGEYATQVQSQNIQSTMIVRDGYTYSWSSMMPNTGFKVRVAQTAGDTGAAASGNYSFDAEQIGDYSCESWSADASMFAVPTNITFQTIN